MLNGGGAGGVSSGLRAHVFYHVSITLVGKVTHSRGGLSAKKVMGIWSWGLRASEKEVRGAWGGRKGEIEGRGSRAI